MRCTGLEKNVAAANKDEGLQVRFHAGCFKCAECGELVVDHLAFVFKGDTVLCSRHWADRHKGRCHACDELVLQQHFIEAMGQEWHEKHFSCFMCDKPLVSTDTKHYFAVADEPHCETCFLEHHADKCASCGEGINPKLGRVAVNG